MKISKCFFFSPCKLYFSKNGKITKAQLPVYDDIPITEDYQWLNDSTLIVHSKKKNKNKRYPSVVYIYKNNLVKKYETGKVLKNIKVLKSSLLINSLITYHHLNSEGEITKRVVYESSKKYFGENSVTTYSRSMSKDTLFENYEHSLDSIWKVKRSYIYEKGLLKRIIEIAPYNLIEITEYNYNIQGDVISETTLKTEDSTTTIEKISYNYKYDAKDNWVEKEIIEEKSRFLIQRWIEYYE